MGDCCKRLDGLSGGGVSSASTPGNVSGDLTVTGDIIVGPGPDGWGNVKSANAANGLDLEAPSGKRIRLINGGKSWVEVDGDGLEIHAPTTGVVGLKVPNLTVDYDFTLPINTGTATQVLTSDGTGATYWSTAAGTGGGGTVTSVDVQSLSSFLTTGGGPITTAGIIGINLSGAPLDIAHGGTGASEATGTGNVVLATSPTLTGPVTVSGGNLIVNGNETINSTTGDVLTVRTTMTATSNLTKLYADSLANGNSVYFILGKNETLNNSGYLGFQLVGVDSVNNYLKLGLFGAPEILALTGTGKVEAKYSLPSTSVTTGSFTTPGGVGLGGDLYVGKSINLVGSTSGVVKLQSQAVAGTWNFNLPTTAGTTGQVLTSQGGGNNAMTWSSAAIGSVTSVGMTVPSFLSVSGSPITAAGSFTVGLSGTALPVTSGGTGVTSSTGTGSVVLSNSPLLTGTTNASALTVGSTATFNGATTVNNNLSVTGTVTGGNLTTSGTITGGRLQCTTTSSHQVNISAGTNNICFFLKQDIIDGGRGYIFVGQSGTDNLTGTIAFQRNDAGNGSRLEFSIWGSLPSVAVYRAFVNGVEYWDKSLVVDGGIGANGTLRANALNTGSADFGYSEGTLTPVLTCSNHTFTYSTRSGFWTRIGRLVTYSFQMTYNVSSGTPAEFDLTLPFTAVYSCSQNLAQSSDISPGSQTASKWAITVLGGGNRAKFTDYNQPTNQYLIYGNTAINNCNIHGSISYHV